MLERQVDTKDGCKHLFNNPEDLSLFHRTKSCMYNMIQIFMCIFPYRKRKHVIYQMWLSLGSEKIDDVPKCIVTHIHHLLPGKELVFLVSNSIFIKFRDNTHASISVAFTMLEVSSFIHIDCMSTAHSFRISYPIFRLLNLSPIFGVLSPKTDGNNNKDI